MQHGKGTSQTHTTYHKASYSELFNYGVPYKQSYYLLYKNKNARPLQKLNGDKT